MELSFDTLFESGHIFFFSSGDFNITKHVILYRLKLYLLAYLRLHLEGKLSTELTDEVKLN